MQVLQLTEEGGANVLGYFVSALACLGKLDQLSAKHLSELYPITTVH